MTATSNVVSAEQLRAFTEDVLRAVDMSAEDAAITADAMLWGELRGLTHHGVAAKLPNLVARIRAGGTNPRATLEVVLALPAMVLYDGHDGWGQVLATRGMRATMERACSSGAAVGVIRNSSSPAALGYYSSLAAAEGMIGMVVSNAVPTMPPWGGATLFIGNQPHSIAAPAGSFAPVVYDSATSAVSTGTLHEYQHRGEPLPEGVALSADGQPTTDPAEALKGLLMPAGDHRGSGIALMWEIITGVLSGSEFLLSGVGSPNALARPQGVSLFLMAIDPTAVMSRDAFAARVDGLLEQLHAVKPQQGIERIFAPGERSAEVAQDRLRRGIPFSAPQLAALRSVAADTSVACII
jgi:LDH2 family malate/lactate/ureidoglycolate dehydrogenase